MPTDPTAIAFALSPPQRRALVWILADPGTRGMPPHRVSVATVRTLRSLGLLDGHLGRAVHAAIVKMDARSQPASVSTGGEMRRYQPQR
jgi:hypothetical protein